MKRRLALLGAAPITLAVLTGVVFGLGNQQHISYGTADEARVAPQVKAYQNAQIEALHAAASALGISHPVIRKTTREETGTTAAVWSWFEPDQGGYGCGIGEAVYQDGYALLLPHAKRFEGMASFNIPSTYGPQLLKAYNADVAGWHVELPPKDKTAQSGQKGLAGSADTPPAGSSTVTSPNATTTTSDSVRPLFLLNQQGAIMSVTPEGLGNSEYDNAMVAMVDGYHKLPASDRCIPLSALPNQKVDASR